MSLKDVQNLSYSIDSLKNDVVGDFYVPCLRQARIYKRAVAYFSSGILLQISEGIGSLADRNGKMRLLVSPKLSEDDVRAIEAGYDLRTKIEENVVKDFEKDYESDFDQKEARYEMLSYMISSNLLDIKIVFVNNPSSYHGDRGFFHKKIGIFVDGDNNRIAFSGSGNDSIDATRFNAETYEIFRSWTSDENRDRCIDKEQEFDSMWDGDDSTITTIPFPEAIKEKILSHKPSPETKYVEIDERYLEAYKEKHKSNIPHVPTQLHIRDPQRQAVENWKRKNYRGVFSMATGSGKTYAACLAITQLFQDKKKLVVFICCPQKYLVDQWYDDIAAFNIKAIKYHSEAKNLNSIKRNSNMFAQGLSSFFCVITTNESFKKPEIQNYIDQNLSSTLLVVDEAHNFGARQISEMMNKNYPYRLGLSATFDRHHDSEGTKKIQQFFGDICIEYTLDQAIKDGFLTPYKYYPIVVALMPDEYDEYMNITRRLPRRVSEDNELDEDAQRLLIKRARLVGGASEKMGALKKIIIDKNYVSKQSMLVYCSDYRYKEPYNDKQINVISRMLNDDLEMRTTQFTANENMDQRHLIIDAFEDEKIQAIVAIKCLDEGIDIPAINTAFILASTTNPREYIQRRGRVLRLYEGKKFAEIYDFVTLPQPQGTGLGYNNPNKHAEQSLAKKEIERVKEFANHSLNPADSYSLINDISNEYELYNVDEEEI